MVILASNPKETSIDLMVPESKAFHIEGLLKSYEIECGSIAEEGSLRIFMHLTGRMFDMSCLLKSLESIEWDGPEKVYIIVRNLKKGGKKHVSKNRAKADQGREGGDREGTDPDLGHGETDRVGGDHDSDWDPGAELTPWAEEGPGTGDDCE